MTQTNFTFFLRLLTSTGGFAWATYGKIKVKFLGAVQMLRSFLREGIRNKATPTYHRRVLFRSQRGCHVKSGDEVFERLLINSLQLEVSLFQLQSSLWEIRNQQTVKHSLFTQYFFSTSSSHGWSCHILTNQASKRVRTLHNLRYFLNTKIMSNSDKNGNKFSLLHRNCQIPVVSVFNHFYCLNSEKKRIIILTKNLCRKYL